VIPEENAVVVGTKDQLLHRGLIAHSVNLMKYAALPQPRRVIAKIRYRDSGAPAYAWTEKDRLYVEFLEPRRAITPGQSVVLYEGDDLIGGGVIAQWYDHSRLPAEKAEAAAAIEDSGK